MHGRSDTFVHIHAVQARLAIHYAENIAVRILEPGDLNIAGDVHVAFALRVREIVVLEPDALRLERAYDVLHIVNGPGEARDADYGVAGGKDDGVIFSKGQPLRKVGRDEIYDALFEEIAKDDRK